MDWPGRSAAGQGFCSCHVCGLVSRLDQDGRAAYCPRCSARLHFRRPDSLQRCWALLIAAYILYIPANLMIMMETGTLISYRKDTILSGVIHLWHNGNPGIAAIVFIASILVPLFKLVVLSLLLISIRRGSSWGIKYRILLYRIVELVGRWSMLDIFVVTLLAALVQIQSLAIVRAGPAAIAFGAVVVLTMFAAMEFDPRLMWDPLRKEREL
ncbi:MAG: paraquat-inducible protein A [Geobacter sp.]|nr:paraquat-inducible protein A [Geobacter sp.]